jgi:uncharacterized Zn ribbon protein
MNTHNCIKCAKEYQDTDVDAYYCGTCKEEAKNIAKQVDAKVANIRSKKKETLSTLEQYDAIRQANGNARFVNARDLGL